MSFSDAWPNRPEKIYPSLASEGPHRTHAPAVFAISLSMNPNINSVNVNLDKTKAVSRKGTIENLYGHCMAADLCPCAGYCSWRCADSFRQTGGAG